MKKVKRNGFKRLASLMLSLCMALIILPVQAKAAGVSEIRINKQTLNSVNRYLVDNLAQPSGTLGIGGCTAQFDPATGILTLNAYQGDMIEYAIGTAADLTIKLIGDNKINSTNDFGISNIYGGDIKILAENEAKLTIDVSSATGDVAGIRGDWSPYKRPGNVSIGGKANVIINVKSTSELGIAFGVFANGKINISENASLVVESTAPINSYGLFANLDLTINTSKDITLKASGTSSIALYSGDFKISLNNAKTMTLRWNSQSSNNPNIIYDNTKFLKDGPTIDGTNKETIYRSGTPFNISVT